MKTGLKGHSEFVVSDKLLASSSGSGLAAVYATPMMISAMEETCAASIAAELAPGQSTVGANVNVSHMAATPPGMKVRIESELTEIAPNGKILTFKVEAYDEVELIGKGSHVRAIIDLAKFEGRVSEKAAKLKA